MNEKILLIEDDESLRALVRTELELLSFDIHETGNGRIGLERALNEEFSLIVLDLNLPEMDGLEICKTLRSKDNDVPILMLTARKDDLDRVLGLELGADDYLVKPFVVRELTARIKAILKRTANRQRPPQVGTANVVEFGPLEINYDMRRIMMSGETVKVSSMEFDLISFLSKNSGKAFTREDIMEKVWGYSAVGYEQNVTTHIARIRAKLEPNPEQPIFLKTIKGFGYAFAIPADFEK